MTEQMKVRNPHSGEYDYQIDCTSAEDVADTCTRLRQGQKSWEAMGIAGRAKILREFGAKIKENRNKVIDALIADTGRVGISVMEVDGFPATIERWIKTAEENAAAEEGRAGAMPHLVYRVERRAYPLVGVISPWNFPVTLSFIDTLPALMAGCAAIIKPSEVTPRFAAPMREIIESVEGLSEVLAIVDGAGETGAAVGDNVDAVCFTGSVATGRKVGEQAAKNFIPSYLELGGKDPALVLESADVDRASTSLLRACVLNSGQACQSIERIYVARKIYDEFLEQLVSKAENVTLNAGDVHKGMLGPITFDKQADILRRQIEDARTKGATIHSGGEVEEHGGLWLKPTVMTGITDDMLVMQDETFGSILPVIPFNTVDEAIAMANDSEFGLSGAVYAGDVAEAMAVGAQMEVGAVSINDGSLTGMMHEAEKNSFKLSGMGGSRMGLSGYLRFFRKQAFITNTGDVAAIEMFDEAHVNYP